MSIFNRDKLSDSPLDVADGSLDLPVDYDDETSPHFVPEHLRERWKRSAGLVDTVSNLQGTVQVIAEHRAWKAARPELFANRVAGMQWTTDEQTGNSIGERGLIRAEPPHMLGEAAAMGNRGAHLFYALSPSGAEEAQRILASDFGTLIAEAEHAIRLNEMQTQHERERRDAEIAHAIDVRNLCPVCNISSTETGAPSTRDIAPHGKGMYGRRISIYSCAGCYLAAVEYMTARLALAPLADGSGDSRLDRVRRHLEATGGPRV